MNKRYDKIFFEKGFDELQIKASFFHLNLAQNSVFIEFRRAEMAKIQEKRLADAQS